MIELKSPISVVWEITNNCNFKCPHCRAYQKREIENETLENKILDELIKSEVFVVNISGGEPLLNPRIFHIIRTLTDNNIYVILSTNGYLYKKYRKEIKDSGVKLVQVSVDGPKEIHEKFRGVKNSYERALESLILAKEDGLRTQMNVTITSSNLHTLKWNYEKALEISLDKIFYRRVVPYGKAMTNTFVLPNKKEYYKNILELFELDNSKIKVLIDDPILSVLKNKTDENYLACSAGINNLGISSNGVVYPCIFLREKIGDLNVDSLQDIWINNEILKKLRNRDIGKCGKCQYSRICGGCRAFSGIYKKDSFCPLQRR